MLLRGVDRRGQVGGPLDPLQARVAQAAAAKAIAPGLAQQHQRYGLAPDGVPAAAKS
ncbi:MAG TPA: hypothetical protein VHN39_09810 [Phenylobacterium sp.]|nr:hypothetical protein [Phenylobacterium sp.]